MGQMDIFAESYVISQYIFFPSKVLSQIRIQGTGNNVNTLNLSLVLDDKSVSKILFSALRKFCVV